MAANDKVTYLKDYKQPDFWVKHVDLEFDLQDGETFVTAKLQVERNGSHNNPLVLDGENLELQSVAIDGQSVSAQGYTQTDKDLTIPTADDKFVLETKVRINPEDNKAFEGLYKSSGNWCTQCEAQGFRHITYFVDRPDNMATFTTKLIADDDAAPVLLSNGNLIDEGKTADGRNYTVWEDPFPKPSYLFALVGGNLEFEEGKFTTMSGRDVTLRVYAVKEDQDKLPFAIDSLKRSMKWDEDVYGREYNFDQFNIVAVSDFNMGAMENTSLNVFNTSCVLAHPDVSTDANYQRVDAVIAHEYFHNWTGNLVTCRDWFQLCLKEGLTVFRDHSYQEDQYSAAAQRIDDVKALRSSQFKEDAGPMAHPPRPDHFETIDNFYTVTVYEKGSELNRMLHALVGGAAEFRKGSDLYFQRHEGQAVTVEDWVKAHEDASGTDLSQFMLWYTQAGTPTIKADWSYDDKTSTFKLTLEQDVPVLDKVSDGSPRHIPVEFGLVGPNGDDVVSEMLEMTAAKHDFEFKNVPPDCVPSILRGFSAPVKLEAPYTDDQLRFLMVNDNDGFNQWDAGNTLLKQKMLEQVDNAEAGKAIDVDPEIIKSFRGIIQDTGMDQQLKALALTLPSYNELALSRKKIDPQAITAVIDAFGKKIADDLQSEWQDLYDDNYDAGKAYDHKDVGRRDVQNKALSYLAKTDDPSIAILASNQYKQANNVTDRLAAYTALMNMETPQAAAQRINVSSDFYTKAKATQDLVVDKWMMGQAMVSIGDIEAHLTSLVAHESFNGTTNPNRIRALYGTFSGANPKAFHAEDGSGYEFLADFLVDYDATNPQITSRLVDAFGGYKNHKDVLADQMYDQLLRLAAMDKISANLGEKVRRFIGDAAYDAARQKKSVAPSPTTP
jgi:aminopeptidase N